MGNLAAKGRLRIGMTLRPLRGSARTVHVVALDYEIAQEQAAAPGRLRPLSFH